MTPSKETRRAEGRSQPEGSPREEAGVRTQSRVALPPNLARVNAAARRAVQTRFTALLHHVDRAALERAFRRQRRQASAGVDGVTVAAYEQDLEAKLQDLCTRIHTGRYRPQPVRRVFIPKADGGQRPLGVPTLEDKIVQGAVAEVLSAIYETDFLGFSYGFRPGRNPHMALDALHTALMSQRVTWVLDADIRSFFDSVDHEWLLRMLAHRIADPRILRLIELWLRAGVLESDEWHETDRGTPQGAGISPLLANVFLHYVLDLWVHQWRRRHARGRVVIVRYADDFVMGFEVEADAREMLSALKERLASFGLTLHADKTRLIEFGRLPALARRRRGERHPETFAFLGFTHYCGWTRDGRFMVKHKTQSRRLTRKLKALRQEAWRLMHAPLAEQHRWYASVLLGHYGYYGRPHNYPALSGFRQQIRRIWFCCLRRRSQKSRRMGWDEFEALTTRFPLPPPRITRPWTPRRT
ncbi:group II intron reverse transcriptase/maturase [Skermanella pratensis]|uniref:group II intron reverse transcriptase/maturase n=1 Tax=Skermanella pratensis TaxID=2233999 RepID=UPI001300FD98|nr:group II intron reverse transcriptase/maturase [Skermanella pratensis]